MSKMSRTRFRTGDIQTSKTPRQDTCRGPILCKKEDVDRRLWYNKGREKDAEVLEMKKTQLCLPALLLALLVLPFTGCGSTGYEPPEGWEVHLVRKTSYLMPKGWTRDDVGYGGYYIYPPDGGMLMVMPASWGMSDLSTEEGAQAAFDYLFGSMDRNIPGFKLGEQEYGSIGGRHSVRADFSADGADGTTVPGVAVFVADKDQSEVLQFAFVLDGPADEELATSMEGIIDSIGGGSA